MPNMAGDDVALAAAEEREREKNNSSTLNSGGFYFHQVLPGLEIKPYQGG